MLTKYPASKVNQCKCIHCKLCVLLYCSIHDINVLLNFIRITLKKNTGKIPHPKLKHLKSAYTPKSPPIINQSDQLYWFRTRPQNDCCPLFHECLSVSLSIMSIGWNIQRRISPVRPIYSLT